MSKTVSRRGLPLLILPMALMAIIGLFLASVMTPTAALQVEADDVVISSDTGRIERLTISPKGVFKWSGLDENVNFDGDDRIVYNIYVKLNDGEWGLLYSAVQTNYKNIEDAGTTGYDKFVFQDIELRKPNVIAYHQLEAKNDGEKKVSKIWIKVEALLQTSDVVEGVTKWRTLASASAVTSFKLTCINEPSEGSIEYELNVQAEPVADT